MLQMEWGLNSMIPLLGTGVGRLKLDDVMELYQKVFVNKKILLYVHVLKNKKIKLRFLYIIRISIIEA